MPQQRLLVQKTPTTVSATLEDSLVCEPFLLRLEHIVDDIKVVATVKWIKLYAVLALMPQSCCIFKFRTSLVCPLPFTNGLQQRRAISSESAKRLFSRVAIGKGGL